MKIIDRIYDYMSYAGYNSSQFEKIVGLSNGYLSKQLARKADIGESIILKVLENSPNLSANWLLTGEGEMTRNAAVAVPVPEGQGIPLIPSEAFCGFGLAPFEDLPIEEYYQVTEFKNADFLMRVKGNSMYPKYSSGDIIACKKIYETLFFQWNKIYAVYTKSQGIMVKRINISEKEGYILLVSDNDKYKPFDVPISDIEAIALVIGVIRVE